MSAEKTKDWNTLWKECTNSMEIWNSYFEAIQKANQDLQAKFNLVWQKANSEFSEESMNMFKETWLKSMNNMSMDSFVQFTETWQKSLSSSGLEQMNAYGQMLKKFTETWSSMWPQPR